MGTRTGPISFRSPWQNGYVERLIGSIRRECTDHLIVFNAEHLRRILAKYNACETGQIGAVQARPPSANVSRIIDNRRCTSQEFVEGARR